MNEDVLQHIGILGMKWGFRRSGGKATPKVQKKRDSSDLSNDHKEATVLKSKNLKTMTNAELNILTKRLMLERQYNELTKVNLSPGKKFVQELFINQGKNLATTYFNKYSTQVVENLIKKVGKT